MSTAFVSKEEAAKSRLEIAKAFDEGAVEHLKLKNQVFDIEKVLNTLIVEREKVINELVLFKLFQ